MTKSSPPSRVVAGMPTLRLVLHVLLAGLYVFLTGLTLLLQLESSDLSLAGMVVLTLMGAWAGASAVLRSLPSLIAAGAGIGALALLALSGGLFNHYLRLFVLVVLVPLALVLWGVVAWRAAAETTPPAAGLKTGPA